MNTNIAYLVIVSLLVMVFLITRNIKTVDSEYFVLDKSEKTFGLTMSFYASGMGLWILTSPAEVAWYGLCLLYTSPSPRDVEESRMPSSA